jgi:hypothetical protein
MDCGCGGQRVIIPGSLEAVELQLQAAAGLFPAAGIAYLNRPLAGALLAKAGKAANGFPELQRAIGDALTGFQRDGLTPDFDVLAAALAVARATRKNGS